MCRYITATLPKDVDLKRAKEVFESFKFGFEQIENLSVREYLEKGDPYILTTRGMCDCGTVLASYDPDFDNSNEARIQKAKARELKKLRKKGWGEAKIRRWQKEIELNKKRTEKEEEENLREAMRRTDDWLDFITTLLKSKAADRIGILVHQYSGGLDSRIDIAGKKIVKLKKLTPRLLVEMKEDVIYDFVL